MQEIRRLAEDIDEVVRRLFISASETTRCVEAISYFIEDATFRCGSHPFGSGHVFLDEEITVVDCYMFESLVFLFTIGR